MDRIRIALLVLGLLWAPPGATAQGVVVDEGRFSVSVGGQEVGSEEFSIRRAGPLGEERELANARITLDLPAGRTELRPVLQLRGTQLEVSGYEMDVSGPNATRIAIRLAGRHYVSSYRSPSGEEEREFRARQGTRILDRGVAHQYHFLREYSVGDRIPVIEPRTRRQFVLEMTAEEEDSLRLRRVTVPARRVVFTDSRGSRTVWFDRQGRLLRVDVPREQYSAVRVDLVG